MRSISLMGRPRETGRRFRIDPRRLNVGGRVEQAGRSERMRLPMCRHRAVLTMNEDRRGATQT